MRRLAHVDYRCVIRLEQLLNAPRVWSRIIYVFEALVSSRGGSFRVPCRGGGLLGGRAHLASHPAVLPLSTLHPSFVVPQTAKHQLRSARLATTDIALARPCAPRSECSAAGLSLTNKLEQGGEARMCDRPFHRHSLLAISQQPRQRGATASGLRRVARAWT